MGRFLDRPLAPFARRIGVNPNVVTVIGFMVNAVAAVVLAVDLRTGGVLVIVGGLFDMFDGAVARINGRVTEFGAFLDSVLDRYSDAFLFMGIAWYMGSSGSMTGVFLCMGSLLGSFGISYARARAEGLGLEGKAGLMERPERIILLVFGALTGWMLPVLWVMFLLTQITVVQRVYNVWNQCAGRE